MKIKDQIRSRRESLGHSTKSLAEKIGVSEMAVRHWEDGRNYPGKSKARDLEAALSFELDWTEGMHHTGEARSATAMIAQEDIDLLLVIARLPLQVKTAIATIARLHLAALDAVRRGPPDDPTPEPKTTRRSRD